MDQLECNVVLDTLQINDYEERKENIQRDRERERENVKKEKK